MKQQFTPLKRITLLLFALAISTQCSFAQNVSTEGTDFWLGFMQHNAPGGADLRIFVSTSQDTVTGTISVPTLGVVQTFTLGANSNSAFEYDLPSSVESRVTSNTVNFKQQNSIHIETDNPISVYALNKAGQYSADATIVLPTVTLGKQYYATCHRESLGGNLDTEILIVGVEDNTDIEVVPTANLRGSVSAGNTLTINLDEGETYFIKSGGDLTGTKISTSNGATSDCKNFAVFSGADRVNVGNCSPGLDHLFQQAYPFKAWGQNFTIVPFQDRSGDLVKIVASEDNTRITINGGAPISLNAGQSANRTLSSVSEIEGSKPISVTQFSRSAGCDGGTFGDPFMITLSPNEQLLKKITFSAFPVFDDNPGSFTYYVDILSPTDGSSTVELKDGSGTPIALSFTPVGNGFSYSQVTLSVTGEHTITSDSGFIANVYGFGEFPNDFESFGYTTGASLNNLNFNIISVDSGQIITDDTEILCLGNSISFSPEIDTTTFKFFQWDMGDGSMYTAKDVEHVYNSPGIYNVQVTASTALGDCATEQTAVKTVEVTKSDFDIIGPVSVCPDVNDIVYTNFNPKGDYSYTWSVVGGDISSGATADTVRVNWHSTNPNASIMGIAVDELGCDDTTLLDVIINETLDPLAPTGEDSVCYADLKQKYTAILANGNGYDWYVEGGTLSEDTSNPDGNTVYVTWDTTATEWKLWFREYNFADTLCAGVSDTFYVATILPEIKELALDITAVTCFGNTDGAFSYSAQGGIGLLSYIYENDTLPSGISESNIAAGNYTVQVLDEVGCAIFPDIVVPQPDSIVLNITANDLSCYNDSSGSILVEPTGGTLPYTFDWDAPITADTSFIDGLSIGQYKFTLIDSNNCEQESPLIDISQPDSITFTINGLDSVCQFTSAKSYTITDNGNDSTYTWIADGGDIEIGTGTKSVDIAWGEAGDRQIKVILTDSLGCVSDTNVFAVEVYALPQPAAPTGADTLCYVDSANVEYKSVVQTGRSYEWFVEGGVINEGKFDTLATVTWNTTSITHKIWFKEYVTADPECLVYSDTLEVTILEQLTSEIVSTDISCFNGADGTITVTPSGGAGNYSYEWTHDASLLDSVASGLTIGDYSVLIKDGFGCEITLLAELEQPSAALNIDVLTNVPVDCNGEATGELEVKVSGGTPPYSYLWDDPLNQTTTTITSLTANTYTFTVTDTNNCVLSDTVTITEPDPFTYTLDTVPSLCKENEGEATIHGNGGTPPYSFVWSSGISNGNSAINLPTGSNLVIVTDDNGCEYEADAYIASKEPELEFPRAFSPNGDGLNDEFQFIYTCDGNISVTIYNRWGDVIFKTTELGTWWDGTSGGQEMPQGVYTYRMVYYVELDGKLYRQEKSGAILLIR